MDDKMREKRIEADNPYMLDRKHRRGRCMKAVPRMMGADKAEYILPLTSYLHLLDKSKHHHSYRLTIYLAQNRDVVEDRFFVFGRLVAVSAVKKMR